MNADTVKSVVIPSGLFWTLLSSIISWDNTNPAEAARAAACCAWVTENTAGVISSTRESERAWMKVFLDHWAAHKRAPNLNSIGDRLSTAEDNTRADYLRSTFKDEVSSGLHTPNQAEDLPALLECMTLAHAATQLTTLGTAAAGIATSIEGVKVDGQPRLQKGVADALIYLERNVLKVRGYTPPEPYKGSLDDSKADIERWANAPTSPIIPCGLDEVDGRVKARLGQFVGIIGYTGSGKTRYCRTWAYHAASLGYRVLHLTLEQSYDEEMKSYLNLHANREYPEKAKRLGLTFSNIHDGLLLPDGQPNKAAWDWLHNVVADDLAAGTLDGLLRVVAPQGRTWEAIKATIETETALYGAFDMVVLDYITLLQIDVRFAREAMAEIITDAKSLAKSYANGHRMLFVTPVQSNKAGKADANAGKGKFDVGAVHTYTIIEQTADVILSVWSDKDLDTAGQVAIGTAKNRFGQGLEPIIVTVDRPTQTFVNLRHDATESTMEGIRKLMGGNESDEDIRRRLGDLAHLELL